MAGFARRQLDVLGYARSGNEAAVQLFAIRDGKTVEPRRVPAREPRRRPGRGGARAPSCASTTRRAGSIPPRVLVPMTLPDAAELEELLGRPASRRVARRRAPARRGPRAHGPRRRATPPRRSAREQARWLADQGKTERALEELADALGLRRAADAHRVLRHQHHPGHLDGRAAWSSSRRAGRAAASTAASGSATSRARTTSRATRRCCGAASGARSSADEGSAEAAALAAAGPGHHRRRQGPGERRRGRSSTSSACTTCRWPGIAKEREELFLPGRSDPIVLPATSQALYLVQRLRDEAHRFAITYHRQVRAKRRDALRARRPAGRRAGAQAGAAARVRVEPRRCAAPAWRRSPRCRASGRRSRSASAPTWTLADARAPGSGTAAWLW